MSEISKDKREKIAARVRALLRMTEEKGCSEAEAMTAAEKAAELMAEYALAAEDLSDIKDEKFGKRSRKGYAHYKGRRAYYHEVQFCTTAIAKFFDCEHYFNASDAELVYFGSELDTELAHYLTDRVRSAMDIGWALFMKTFEYRVEKEGGTHPKTMRAQYMYGFSARVRQRLNEMKEAQKKTVAASTNANALVVCKQAIVKERFKETGIKVASSSTSGALPSASARNAGARDGSSVTLNTRGIGAGGVQRRIT